MASSNTSKTAHVMNLLSKNRTSAAEPAKPQAEPAKPQTESAPAASQAEPVPEEPVRTAPVAPIISSINADAAVSSQIKSALEAELEELAPPPVQAPVQKTTPVQPPVQEAPPVQPPIQEAPPVQAPPVQEEVPPEPQSAVVEPPAPPVPPVQENPPTPVLEEVPMDLPAKSSEPAEEISYINVMEILVDEKADQYMKMFGICCCDKCRVDVRAFALNHLPPKYVVLSDNERVPRLTIYEQRFASDVTAQLLQACKQVMLTPHHSRDGE